MLSALSGRRLKLARRPARSSVAPVLCCSGSFGTDDRGDGTDDVDDNDGMYVVSACLSV